MSHLPEPYWQSPDGAHVLYCACCEDVLQMVQADCVVTDPPYGVGLTHKQHKWFHQRGDGYLSTDDSPEYIREVVAPVICVCIARFGRVVVACGVRNMWLYPPPNDLGTAFNRAGAGRGPWGFNCNNPILFYGKCPYMERGMGGRPNSYDQPVNDYAIECDHPCPKPLGMMRWMVERASIEGQTVLDPFAGSGTTAVACIRSGRRSVSIEKEPRYCEIAKRRMEEAIGVGTLFDPKAIEATLFTEATP